MRKLIMEKAAIKNNLSVIKDKANGAAVYGVLTGDAGGAGIVPVANILRDEGIGRFAVSEVSEAVALRRAGFVDEEILMLRATTDRAELEQLLELNVVFTVSSVDTGLALNALAEARSTVVEAHIQVDTGMGFERACAMMQCTNGFTDFSRRVSNYSTDVFRPIFRKIE